MRRYFPNILIVWVIIIICAFLLNVFVLRKNTENLVQTSSEAFYKLLLTTSQWNFDHETVYVPVTETMRPDPNLTHSRRVVVTNFGDSLTIVNAALMTRQVAELAEKNKITRFHLTSLNPIRPENKPDKWETKVLQTFRNIDDRFFENIKSGDSIYFRYMAPLFISENCFSCHVAQGYQTGDLKGGISITTSYRDDHLTYISNSSHKLIIIYSLILMIGLFLLFFIESISKKHRLAVETKHKELQDLNAAKDKFISIVAHDLRTPAANIESLSKVLSESFDDFNEEERRSCIDLLVESAKTHTELVNTLLDLSRLRLGSQQYQPERLDIRKIASEVLEQTKLQAQQKQISQKNNTEECFINADKDMITTVIRNLVVNGIKFTHPGGQIIVQTEKKNKEVIISVADNGIGIDDAKKDRIFGVDSNKSTTGTANETGTGLGLLLCKEYVERHGGSIWLESELGKGTTFFFALPAL